MDHFAAKLRLFFMIWIEVNLPKLKSQKLDSLMDSGVAQTENSVQSHQLIYLKFHLVFISLSLKYDKCTNGRTEWLWSSPIIWFIELLYQFRVEFFQVMSQKDKYPISSFTKNSSVYRQNPILSVIILKMWKKISVFQIRLLFSIKKDFCTDEKKIAEIVDLKLSHYSTFLKENYTVASITVFLYYTSWPINSCSAI